MSSSSWWGTPTTSSIVFPRIVVALEGRDYFTVVGMLRQFVGRLACNVQTAHLSQVWGWNQLKEQRCFYIMRNLDPVHAFRFSRSGGIYMQWKQWCTDESWSRPVLLVPQEDIPSLASLRPPCLDMEFSAGQSILDWINRFEVCALRSPWVRTTAWMLSSGGCVPSCTTRCLGSTSRARR